MNLPTYDREAAIEAAKKRCNEGHIFHNNWMVKRRYCVLPKGHDGDHETGSDYWDGIQHWPNKKSKRAET